MRRASVPAVRLQVANSYDEFEGQTVIDLGCGTVRALCLACEVLLMHVMLTCCDKAQ